MSPALWDFYRPLRNQQGEATDRPGPGPERDRKDYELLQLKLENLEQELSLIDAAGPIATMLVRGAWMDQDPRRRTALRCCVIFQACLTRRRKKLDTLRDDVQRDMRRLARQFEAEVSGGRPQAGGAEFRVENSDARPKPILEQLSGRDVFDATRYQGVYYRDHQGFGSPSSHDDYSDEGMP